MAHRSLLRLWVLPISLAALFATGCETTASASGPGPKAEIQRTLLEKRDVDGAPGLETQLWLIQYPPAAKAPTHRHPVVGLGYVIEGEFESVFGEDAPVRVKAGQSFVDPARTEHRAFRNVSAQQPLKFVMVYTIGRGKAVVEF